MIANPRKEDRHQNPITFSVGYAQPVPKLLSKFFHNFSIIPLIPAHN